MSDSVVLFDPSTGSSAKIIDGVLQTGAVLTSTAITASTLSDVASSATNVTLLAANASRIGAIITNDSTADLFIKFGTTATTSSFTAKLSTNDAFVIDSALLYKGAIDGIWSSANGFARITEFS